MVQYKRDGTIICRINLLAEAVIIICISTNFIEQEAYKYYEEIQKNSLYELVNANRAESNYARETDGVYAVITKVTLKGEDGAFYPVAPNPNGLKFAKKEITYKEYKKLQNKETRNAFITFAGIVFFLVAVMVTTAQYFTW